MLKSGWKYLFEFVLCDCCGGVFWGLGFEYE